MEHTKSLGDHDVDESDFTADFKSINRGGTR